MAVRLDWSCHPCLPIWVDGKVPFPKREFLWLAGVICHNKSRLSFSPEVRQNHSQKKTRVGLFLF